MLQTIWRMSLTALVVCLAAGPAALAQDNLEGPWPTIHADNYGRMRTNEIIVPFGTGTGAQEGWRLNAAVYGADRPGGRGSLVFDVAGNIYWRTTLGNNKLISVATDGSLRWVAKAAGGASDFVFGDGWNSASPVVGEQRVYALGAGAYGGGGEPVIAAFSKVDGSLIWETLLTDEPPWTNDGQVTPALYDGKLYVLGESDSFYSRVYQIDAATGNIDWVSDPFDMIYSVSGQMVFVPNVFPDDDHGLYFQATNGDGLEGLEEIHGIKIDPDPTTGGATQAWQAQGGGPVARSHLIYNPYAPGSGGVGRIYAHTWNDWGATMYAYDPITGATFNSGGQQPSGGHGFYDVGGVDWDDETIIAGGFDGRFGLYLDNGDDTFTVDMAQFNSWFGEPRVLGQIVKDCGGNTVMITGTNSRSDLGGDYDARVIVANLTTALKGGFDDGPVLVDDIEFLVTNDINSDPSTWTSIYAYSFDALAVGPIDGQAYGPGYVAGSWLGVIDYDDDQIGPDIVDNLPGGRPGKAVLQDPSGADGTIWFEGWPFANVVDPLDPASPAYGYEYVIMRWWQYRTDLTDNVRAYGSYSFDNALAWDIDRKYHALGGAGPTAPQAIEQWQKVERLLYFDPSIVENTARIRVDDAEDDPGAAPAPFPILSRVDYIDFSIDATSVTDAYNEPMVEYATGVVADHAFTIRGGPLLGPSTEDEDGKIYYFDGNTRELVALIPVTVKGDSNCDDVVNGFDIDAFVLALIGQAEWEAMYACDYIGANDLNNDGVVNGFDIDAFIGRLQGDCR
ncbi:MAG: PQQ-binding-like beta-propeller repeat protein [Planctomycetes bacterium]|nr:PQQ-binding-like beta-propeller repeat protein [Planctomycetota bacterium]